MKIICEIININIEILTNVWKSSNVPGALSRGKQLVRYLL